MEEKLMDLGLTKNEAKTYLALTELGSSSASKIASKAKIHRTNVYEAIDRLLNKGLLSYAIIDDTKIFQATDPENLLRQIKLLEVKANELIPHLKIREQIANKEGIASIHKGISAFVNILNSQLKSDDIIKVYGIPSQAVEMMKTQIPHFHTERIKKKISMFHIYNYDAITRIKFLNKMPYTKAKYIDDLFKSQASTLVCGDEVITTLWTGPIYTIRIINNSIANSYRHNFDLLWKMAITPR